MGLQQWALLTLFVAFAAGALGYTGRLQGAGTAAKVVAAIALVITVILLITSFLVGTAAI
jgi:uncharacterized membrane protein YtjA (UPF0391 family)